MSENSFLPYAHQSISAEDVFQVGQSLSQETITRGNLVELFEKSVAEYCGAKYAVAFNSATSALMAACHAGKVSSHDRFFTTPNSFVATTGAGMSQGANPIFIDIDENTGGLSLEQLEYNLNNFSCSRGKPVIILTHFAGIPVDMQKLDGMIKNPDTLIIEDAAHAIGSCYSDGQKVGCCAWSHMTVFSFHPAKTITTGEGGMVTTNREEFYHALRLFRNNGIEKDPKYLLEEPTPWSYEVHEITGNFNFTEMQAALGISQLKRMEQFVEKRRRLMASYRELLKAVDYLKMFDAHFDAFVAYHLCVVQIDFSAYKKTRNEVMERLKEKRIGTQVHYIPIYRFPFLASKSGDLSHYFPHTEKYYSQALSIPLYFDLAFQDVERVVNTLKQVLENK